MATEVELPERFSKVLLILKIGTSDCHIFKRLIFYIRMPLHVNCAESCDLSVKMYAGQAYGRSSAMQSCRGRTENHWRDYAPYLSTKTANFR